MYRIGQKVICVDDDFSQYHYFGEQYPQKNCIYTVRNFSDGEHIRLVEIINNQYPYNDGFMEVSFRATRFRPIVERKTDISIFTEMLRPMKESV